MIQRIQTLYIIIAGLLTGMLFTSPVATYLMADSSIYKISITGISGENQTIIVPMGKFWPVWSLDGIILSLMLLSIFLYRRRETQMRITVYSTILLAGLEGMMIYYIHHFSGIVDAAGKGYSYPLIFPVIAIILLILAIRSIRKDELLATAYQRLR